MIRLDISVCVCKERDIIHHPSNTTIPTAASVRCQQAKLSALIHGPLNSTSISIGRKWQMKMIDIQEVLVSRNNNH